MRVKNLGSWFKIYENFALDEDIQRLSEVDQRRLVMLACFQFKECLSNFSDTQISWCLGISDQEWKKTKSELQKRGFLSKEGPFFLSVRHFSFSCGSSRERTRKYRGRQKESSLPALQKKMQNPGGDVTELCCDVTELGQVIDSKGLSNGKITGSDVTELCCDVTELCCDVTELGQVVDSKGLSLEFCGQKIFFAGGGLTSSNFALYNITTGSSGVLKKLGSTKRCIKYEVSNISYQTKNPTPLKELSTRAHVTYSVSQISQPVTLFSPLLASLPDPKNLKPQNIASETSTFDSGGYPSTKPLPTPLKSKITPSESKEMPSETVSDQSPNENKKFCQEVTDFFVSELPGCWRGISDIMTFWASQKAQMMMKTWRHEGVILEDIQKAVSRARQQGTFFFNPLFFANCVLQVCHARKGKKRPLTPPYRSALHAVDARLKAKNRLSCKKAQAILLGLPPPTDSVEDVMWQMHLETKDFLEEVKRQSLMSQNIAPEPPTFDSGGYPSTKPLPTPPKSKITPSESKK